MKIFPKTTRGAFAFAVSVSVLTACAPNPNGLGVADYGTVTGRVVDRDSLMPISGATISIGNIVSITAVIDNGGFVLHDVPVGTEALSIDAIGWQSYHTTLKVTRNATADAGTIGLPSALVR